MNCWLLARFKFLKHCSYIHFEPMNHNPRWQLWRTIVVLSKSWSFIIHVRFFIALLLELVRTPLHYIRLCVWSTISRQEWILLANHHTRKIKANIYKDANVILFVLMENIIDFVGLFIYFARPSPLIQMSIEILSLVNYLIISQCNFLNHLCQVLLILYLVSYRSLDIIPF